MKIREQRSPNRVPSVQEALGITDERLGVHKTRNKRERLD
jgi:hypothetical protein